MYTILMKSVPLKDLKERLAFWTAQAAKGIVVQVTRYNRPYIYLTDTGVTGLNVGKLVGKGELRAILNKPLPKGKLAEVLAEDRGEE